MARVRKCPICNARADKSYDPFCSQRCANLDLAKWLNGDYRIPVDDEPDDGELERGSPEAPPRLN